MSTLFQYQKLVQKFLKDQRQGDLNPQDLIEYINISRREVAMRTQCVRVLTPISGAVVSAKVIAGGSGYTNPVTVSITPPDFPSGTGLFPNGSQATGAAILNAGAISAVNITYGGSGYFQPQCSITGAGTGASVSLTTSFVNSLKIGQEVYPFSSVDLSQNPGVDSIYAVKSISILYSGLRYSLPVANFSVYQAKIRTYPQQYMDVPVVASQYGQGTSGSFYVYPLPSQTYQYELDCFCLPSDLIDNQSVDVLPQPWSEGVPYFAAALCYQELQNLNAAQYYHQQFDLRVMRYSSYARPGRTVNPYGRSF